MSVKKKPAYAKPPAPKKGKFTNPTMPDTGPDRQVTPEEFHVAIRETQKLVAQAIDVQGMYLITHGPAIGGIRRTGLKLRAAAEALAQIMAPITHREMTADGPCLCTPGIPEDGCTLHDRPEPSQRFLEAVLQRSVEQARKRWQALREGHGKSWTTREVKSVVAYTVQYVRDAWPPEDEDSDPIEWAKNIAETWTGVRE